MHSLLCSPSGRHCASPVFRFWRKTSLAVNSLYSQLKGDRYCSQSSWPACLARARPAWATPGTRWDRTPRHAVPAHACCWHVQAIGNGLFEPAVMRPETVGVPTRDFDAVATPIAKHKPIHPDRIRILELRHDKQEAAQLLDCGRPYVTMWVEAEMLAGAVTFRGGHQNVPKSSVLHWIEVTKAENSGGATNKGHRKPQWTWECIAYQSLNA